MVLDARSWSNDAYRYATLRNALHRKGKMIEILVNYEPSSSISQSGGNSSLARAKAGIKKVSFPASVNFSADLHSMGQFIQDGMRNLFETVVWVERSSLDVTIQPDSDNLDGLNCLAGSGLNQVNYQAFQGTPVSPQRWRRAQLSCTDTGSSLHFTLVRYSTSSKKACGVSGYLSGVNPFDQPGVGGL